MSQENRHTYSAEPQPPVSVVIVGSTELELFRPLLASLRSDPAVRIRAELPAIADALKILPDSQLADPQPHVDVVIVLQSHSDEFSALHVQLLIGRMLFGRVVCCYGPWCQADGRTHLIWPVSCRVPVASAAALLSAEFDAVREQRPALSPMSAGEEVFLHRNLPHVESAGWKPTDFCVVSDDRVLRNSVAQLCEELCGELQPSALRDCTVRTTSLQAARNVLQVRSAPSRALVVLIDLDPLDELCRELLHWLDQNEVPGTKIGITVFATSSFSLPTLNEIFDKLELSARLRELPTLMRR